MSASNLSASGSATVYNYGSINIDHVYRVPHLVRPGETLSSTDYQIVLGGKGANQTIALARAGGRVAHWAQLGQADEWALATLKDAGADIDDVTLLEGSSGHTVIQVDDDGENAIVLFGGTNQSFSKERIRALIDGADSEGWLLLQNECNDIEDVIRQALGRGLKVAFNPAPMTPAIRELALSELSLLFVNRGEAAALVELPEESNANTLIQALQQALPNTDIVLTLGSEGAWRIDGERNEPLYQPARPVQAVDTTGAGDTFIGYYMAAVQAGCDASTCLERATAAAALAVQRAGAATGIPTIEEVETFLQIAARQP
ncbi:ribokinase [Kushneria indalinina]|uniref:Ribokinase n=1 Tax=Kushneria indalinina DSM 14324 TaxID=1122140 RepID=A0A3D9DXZ2_9GAMM|nr:ribokinase [Kushneria indalinina]REC95154.1 ribokinase [Kushneria indalinina DSM 14324]